MEISKKSGFVLLVSITSLFLPITVNAADKDVWSAKDERVCLPNSDEEFACFGVARQYLRNGQVVETPNLSDLLNVSSQVATFNMQKNPNFKPAAVKAIAGGSLAIAYSIDKSLGSASDVVAIIDAYDSPSAYSNMSKFRSDNGLKPIIDCTSSFNSNSSTWPSAGASPCFVKVNQNLSKSPLPKANSGWANEIDLDIQAVSAICPNCSILLVEANSASLSNLGTAISKTANLAYVKSISNSYGTSSDYSQATNSAWNIAAANKRVFASSGDAGYQTSASFPASNTNVVAVGGTTLNIGSDGKRSSESAWSGAGSGCSTSNAKPTWQVGLTSCNLKAVSDVSAVADPASGLTIYTIYKGRATYMTFGGTSLASPIVAAVQAMRGGYTPDAIKSSNYFEVSTGSNGSCGPALCSAVTLWDGPTGFGSIFSL